jgi:transcriptional regulator with XRE-family HTH domain
VIEVPNAGKPTKAPSNGDLGRAIRELRVARGLTIKALALAVHMHLTHLSKIERGKTNPTRERLGCLANALEIPIATLARHAEQVAQRRRPRTSVATPNEGEK